MVCATDEFRPPVRPILDKPLRLCVTDVFKAVGAGVSVSGMIHTGSVQAGDRLVVVPAGETATVKGSPATHCILLIFDIKSANSRCLFYLHDMNMIIIIQQCVMH